MRTGRAVLSVCAAALATALVVSAQGEQPRNPGPAPTPVPAPNPGPVPRPRVQPLPKRGDIPVVPGSTVTTSCKGNVVHVSICSDTQHCTEALDAACVPYGCDAAKKWCASSCVTDADCSTGSACDTVNGKCAMMPNQCADAFTVVTGGDLRESCAPYKCAGGRCWQQCQGNGDCAPGYVCQNHAACVRG